MQLNNRPSKGRLAMLIPALIGTVILSSCTGMFSSETVASSARMTTKETTAVVQMAVPVSVTETDAVTETTESTTVTTTKAATEAPATTGTTSAPKTTVADTTITEQSATAESSSQRKTLKDLVTMPTFPTTTKATTTSQPATNADGSIDLSCFDNSAFVGNSRLLAAGNYGLVDHVYAKVGLNVNTVFTDYAEGGSVPVIDELNGKNYDNVFLMFGDNECGWSSMDTFVKQYVKVVDAVREKIPGAKIYILSVLPISKEKSDKNEYGYNINSINNVNKYIKQMCQDQGLTYVDAASSLAGSDGYLPAEASTDGCHMGKKYTRIWLEYTAKNM